MRSPSRATRHETSSSPWTTRSRPPHPGRCEPASRRRRVSSSRNSCPTFLTCERTRTLMTMSDEALRVPEVARRLGIDGTEVYDLIFRGELKAAKGKDGLVYVRESVVEDYKRSHAAA